MAEEMSLFTVYSYGGGEAIYYVFNAIKMLVNSGLIKSLIDLSFMLGLIWAALKSGIERDHHRPYVKWLMTYVFIITALIPTHGGMTLHIRDTVTNSGKSVDNLPPGLVVPAAFISNIGYSLTKNFEAAFSLSDTNYLKYHEYGTMFGAEVMSELENFKIQSPILRENLESYVNNCIMYDVMIGHTYDIGDLKTSTDILKLITENASNIRMFNYRDPKSKGRALKTCKEGIELLSNQLAPEADLLSKVLPTLSKGTSKSNGSNSGLSSNSNSNSQNTQVQSGILNALSVALGFYGLEKTGAEQINQLLLINAFKLHPNSYGTVRAAQSQNSSWKLTGEMAKQTLPIIHALFQALIYGVFPIVICMLFFPGGTRALLSYFGMMIWIELWAPLFAILNLIVSVFARSSGIGDITIQSLDYIVSSQSNYALAAAGLGMMIPALSYMIVKGGAGQFVHMAGSLTGATVQGANAAAQEVISGNRSFDNIWSGNKTQNNISANKFDTSPYIDASGHIREKLPDGAYQTDFVTGKTIYQSGDGITSSSGQVAIAQSGGIKATAQRAYQEQMAHSQTLAEEYAKTTQSFDRHTVDYLSTMAEAQSKGKQYDINTSTEEGKSLTAILSKAHELHEKYDYSWQQATEMALNMNLGGGSKKGGGGLSGSFNLGIGPLSVSLSGSAGLGMEASVTAKSNQYDDQNVGESSSANRSQQVADHQSQIKKWTESVHYGEADTKEQRLADSISQTYETAKSQRESLQTSNSKLEHLQKTISTYEESGLQYTASDYDNFRGYIASRPHEQITSLKIGNKKARQIIDDHGSEFHKYWEEYQNSIYVKQKQDIESRLDAQETKLATRTNFNTDEKVAEYNPVDTTSKFKTDMQAKHFNNFDVDGTGIQNAVEDQKAKIAQTIDTGKAGITIEEARLREEVDNAERAKSLVGRIFARDNQNVEGDNPDFSTVASTLSLLTPRLKVSSLSKALPKSVPLLSKHKK